MELAYPQVEWRQATRWRNRIVHGCWDVDFQILHDVATVNLPTVAEGLGQALADQSDPTADD
ncbi:HepT-like ribonuclease domain-containing protein [Nocardioides humi]|uniref:HepT-like ribonuclease domain-containing protein n=1 Tax=Nocardioides humi TaxID=449461 RepID=UPI00112D80B7|nr:HepT-like ribonuclease domain-containing protein [Nocardioides humi]